MAKYQEEPEECEEGAPAWMVTFADLVTLLLTFFVLLLSFANTDEQMFNEMKGSVKDAFGVSKESRGTFEKEKSESVSSRPEIIKLEKENNKMLRDIRKLINKLGLKGSSMMKLEKDGLKITIKGQALFAPGRTKINESVFVLLDEFKKQLDKYKGFTLVVEGHTDNIPIKSSLFPSNWELSSARAISVIRYFMEELDVKPKRLLAVGYADTKPIATNDTPEGRAENRRVEFRLKKEPKKKTTSSRRRGKSKRNLREPPGEVKIY